ncbi:MAG: hypothetical protein WCL06_09810 [Bacteroidota bacterium]
MKKALAILISVQILSAAVVLPKGDFGILMQLPRIIESYRQANGDVSVFDFFEEEFFDKVTAFDREDEQESPFEKEPKTIPIDMVVSGIYMLCYYQEQAEECIIPVETKAEYDTPYVMNYSSTDLNSIFHPPEASC